MPALIQALRPNQWIKNLSVFAAVILTGQLFNSSAFYPSLVAFVGFCLLSSSSYLVNDLVDIDKDRLHPVKKNRPLARGAITKKTAIMTAVILFLVGLFFASRVNSTFLSLAIIFIF